LGSMKDLFGSPMSDIIPAGECKQEALQLYYVSIGHSESEALTRSMVEADMVPKKAFICAPTEEEGLSLAGRLRYHYERFHERALEEDGVKIRLIVPLKDKEDD